MGVAFCLSGCVINACVAISIDGHIFMVPTCRIMNIARICFHLSKGQLSLEHTCRVL